MASFGDKPSTVSISSFVKGQLNGAMTTLKVKPPIAYTSFPVPTTPSATPLVTLYVVVTVPLATLYGTETMLHEKINGDASIIISQNNSLSFRSIILIQTGIHFNFLWDYSAKGGRGGLYAKIQIYYYRNERAYKGERFKPLYP
jgi:hypothetical protein